MKAAPVLQPMAAIGYVRVSTEDQARDDKSSLADQRAGIAILAQRLGLDVGEMFEDAGVSGGSADRPGFRALLAFCKAQPRPRRTHAPGYVLVLNDSRWGRFPNPEEATYWRFELERAGWLVRFVEGDQDTTDLGMRTIMRSIHSVQATAYREALRANTRRGTRGSAAQGFWLTRAPFGYRRLASGGNRPPQVLEHGQWKGEDQRSKLTPGPAEEVETVQWLFQSYASGLFGLGELARELRRRHPSVWKWSKQGVNRMLRNRAYLGEVGWCRTSIESGRRTDQPTSEWVVVPDAHPALVSPAVFEAVQERMVVNRKATRAVAGGYPLSGLIHCRQCGEPYIGAGGPKGPAGDPDRYRFYRDRGAADDYRKCTGHTGTLQKRWVEPLVVGVIADIVEQPAVQREIAAAIDRLLQGTGKDPAAERRQRQKQRDQLAAKRQRLVHAIASGTLTTEEAGPELETIRSAEARLAAELEAGRFADRQLVNLDDRKAKLLAMAKDFRSVATRLTGPRLRELLVPWIDNAIVDKEKRVLQLTVRRVPGVMNVLQSATTGGPSSQNAKVRLVETRVIPLPRTAWVARRRKAGGEK